MVCIELLALLLLLQGLGWPWLHHAASQRRQSTRAPTPLPVVAYLPAERVEPGKEAMRAAWFRDRTIPGTQDGNGQRWHCSACKATPAPLPGVDNGPMHVSIRQFLPRGICGGMEEQSQSTERQDV